MKPRRGFRHPIGSQELPKQLTVEKLTKYYGFLRHAKNPGVRKAAAHKIIMSHARLGMSLVARWALGYPWQIDDMVSEMLMALVDGVEMIAEGAIDSHGNSPNIGGYLAQTIHGRINKMLAQKPKDPGAKIIRSVPGDQGCLDLMEIITRSIETRQERTVIELRIEGYNDAQIGQMLEPQLTEQRVYQIRTVVKRRIQEQLC